MESNINQPRGFNGIYKSIPFNQRFSFPIDGQEPSVYLKGTIELYKSDISTDENDLPTTVVAIWVLFDGTTISAVKDASSDRVYNKNDDQGYFTESLHLQVTASSADGPIDLYLSSPSTGELTQTVSSSLTLDAGFFGSEATGGASYSHNYSVTVNDFSVTNGSQDTMDHLYYLTAYDGGTYTVGDPSSMVDHPRLVAVTAANTPSPSLFGLPEIIGRAAGWIPKVIPVQIVGSPTNSSIHDYSIKSQAIFKTDFSDDKEVTLKIDFTAVWKRVYIDWHEVLNNPTVPFSDDHTQTGSNSLSITFHLKEQKPAPKPPVAAPTATTPVAAVTTSSAKPATINKSSK